MPSASQTRSSAALLATARCLGVDRVSAEVVEALRAAGIRSILLKGPSIVRWLYDDGTFRPYSDSDILVAPHELARAQEILRELGFRKRTEPFVPDIAMPEDPEWIRGGDVVDLVTKIGGVGLADEQAWAILSGLTIPQRVGGTAVDVLAPTARALHVVLHAAKHGRAEPKPMEDLRRVLAKLSCEDWSDVAELAATLDATERLAAGVTLLPEGEAVATELNLSAKRSVETALRANTTPFIAVGLEEIRQLPGVRAKSKRVLREVFPSPAFLRWWTPLARRGPVGLVAAYAWRLIWIGRHIVPGARAWYRAWRET